ncbi:MAG: phosphoglucosamine mutase [Oscillospiraceae bacterium]|nr:phosphoglucosamine mutase [Oscillospiraceae bacterium]
MGRLFGTDGIRGIANRELTAELALNLGRVFAETLDHNSRVFIARDTRVSGPMLVYAIGAGLMSGGTEVVSLGILPTPAVAYLLQKHGAAAGIMVTASHNPGEYNGIKIFGADGRKLADSLEDEIEGRLLRGTVRQAGMVGARISERHAAEEYIQFLRSSALVPLNGLAIALDCANGASCVTAEGLFGALGANIHTLGNRPNGHNINENCGSLHPEELQRTVIENNLAAGFAFDGDADRVLAVDEHGNVVDGDQILAMCALDMQERGTLAGGTLVATVMSNFGLRVFCKAHGIAFRTAQVGDRYVLDELLAGGFSLGGEQSGHIIFTQHSTAGDGQLTSLQILQIMLRTGKPLSKLAGVMAHYPQVQRNIPVSQLGKLRLADDEEIQSAAAQAQRLLGENGRVLLRASGTEPLVRVMVEGQNSAQIETIARELEELVRRQLL